MEMEMESGPTSIPPLAPGIQTSILSHLLPPQLPLPQHLLSKSLLQRHLYLPPSPDDPDAFLSPIPQTGISERLERLVATGWRVQEIRYATDGESTLALLRVVEDGPSTATDETGLGVDVVFEWEGGNDGRGWTYLSCGDSGLGDLEWTSDPSQIPSIIPSTTNAITDNDRETHSDPHPHARDGNEDGMLEASGGEAPEGYWGGFTPPPSPPLDSTRENGGLGEGEDDYWASYDKTYTPGGTPGGVTPAMQSTPGPSRRNSHLHPHSQSRTNDTLNPDSNTEDALNAGFQDSHDSGSGSGSAVTSTDADSQLLRSRLQMKIASLLKRIWTSYLPESDMEYRALTFLSLARSVQYQVNGPNLSSREGVNGTNTMASNGLGHAPGSGSGSRSGPGLGDGTEGIRTQLEMLYEIYEVMDPISKHGSGEDGFYRLVEGSLSTRPGEREFGEANRQDSSAQLDYWE